MSSYYSILSRIRSLGSWKLLALSLCALTVVTSCDHQPEKIDTVMLVYDEDGVVIEEHRGTHGRLDLYHDSCVIYNGTYANFVETNRPCTIVSGDIE